MENQDRLINFKIEIFDSLGTKRKELIVRVERKNDCHLEAVRWINGNLHLPMKCSYKIS